MIIPMNKKKFNTIVLSFISFLKQKKYTISLAESCTGGLFSKILTDFSGSSSYFKGSVIVYSNETKIKILSVNKDTILKHGAVSKQTVSEMLNGLDKYYDTNIKVAITGIAGPGSDETDKPVGLVWTGIKINDKKCIYKSLFKGTRKEIRSKTVCKTMKRIGE